MFLVFLCVPSSLSYGPERMGHQDIYSKVPIAIAILTKKLDLSGNTKFSMVSCILYAQCTRLELDKMENIRE